MGRTYRRLQSAVGEASLKAKLGQIESELRNDGFWPTADMRGERRDVRFQGYAGLEVEWVVFDPQATSHLKVIRRSAFQDTGAIR
jgi:hypothetical protein